MYYTMKSQTELINQIIAAFANVERGDGVTLHEARLIDDNCEDRNKYDKARKKDTEQNWNDIPDDKIIDFGDTLPFLNAEGFRFYLPAFMVYSLNNIELSTYARVAVEMMLTFDVEKDNVSFAVEFIKKKTSLLTKEQIDCCINFLEYMMELGDYYCISSKDIRRSLQVFWYKQDTWG